MAITRKQVEAKSDTLWTEYVNGQNVATAVLTLLKSSATPEKPMKPETEEVVTALIEGALIGDLSKAEGLIKNRVKGKGEAEATFKTMWGPVSQTILTVGRLVNRGRTEAKALCLELALAELQLEAAPKGKEPAELWVRVEALKLRLAGASWLPIACDFVRGFGSVQEMLQLVEAAKSLAAIAQPKPPEPTVDEYASRLKVLIEAKQFKEATDLLTMVKTKLGDDGVTSVIAKQDKAVRDMINHFTKK